MTERKLKCLAERIKQRNEIDYKIAKIIGRPAEKGHIGEFIAADIFDIELHESATNKGSDGVFRSGPFAGRSANVKFNVRRRGDLAMNLDDPPDFYLVLTGPKPTTESSKGRTRVWTISSAFLFDHHELVSQLTEKIGTATSGKIRPYVKNCLWDEAEIYPKQNDVLLRLTPKQYEMLKMFEN